MPQLQIELRRREMLHRNPKDYAATSDEVAVRTDGTPQSQMLLPQSHLTLRHLILVRRNLISRAATSIEIAASRAASSQTEILGRNFG
jgi:hypothetical protein